MSASSVNCATCDGGLLAGDIVHDAAYIDDRGRVHAHLICATCHALLVSDLTYRRRCMAHVELRFEPAGGVA
jgi:hypothetical protein